MESLQRGREFSTSNLSDVKLLLSIAQLKIYKTESGGASVKPMLR